MKKKRRIWIFAMVFAIAAVQGTVFAKSPEIESSVDHLAESTTEMDKTLGTKSLMENTKEKLYLPIEAEKIPTKKSSMKQSKKVQETVKKTADGQTLLDVSQGNITIKSTGATGGGGYKQ